MEHQRVGPIVTERDGNVLLAKLEAVIDERIVYNGDEFSQQPFRCIICNASYDLHHDIRSHVRRHHVYKMLKPPMEPKKEFICDMCGMLLKSKHAIMKHLQIHTNIKSYPCKFCGKFFRLGSTRTIHERQHTGEVIIMKIYVPISNVRFPFYRSRISVMNAGRPILVKDC